MCFPAELPSTMRLTKATAAKLTVPAGKSEQLWFDDNLPGFGLRIREGGKRTWIAQYRLGTKQRRITLGAVDVLDADEARRRARAVLGSVAHGVDPATAKAESKAQAGLTFGSLVPRYLTAKKDEQAPGHHEDVRRYLERHWAPLAGVALVNIDRQRVAARLGELKTESGPFATNRARAALSAFFSWAIGEGLANLNPVVGTNKAIDETPRDRALSNEELALIWKCAGSGDYGVIVRLLILTACRREEVGAMNWPEVRDGTWTIPGERTKNGRPLELPLPALAMSVLGEVSPRDGRDLVFGSRAGPFSGWSKCKDALDERMLAEAKAVTGKRAVLLPWRHHDLRRTAATGMADLGVQPHVVEAVLNHVSGHKAGVAGIYNRAAYREEKRAALALWAEHVAKIAGVEA